MMFFDRNKKPYEMEQWTEISIIIDKRLQRAPVKVMLPIQAGEVTGFRCLRNRLVINTSSGIPVIACAATLLEMEDAIISVKKLGS